MKEILDRLPEEELIRILERSIKSHPTIPCITCKNAKGICNGH